MIYRFLTDLNRLVGSQALREASREELAVLVAVVAQNGRADGERLAVDLGISAPRIAAAVAYWETCGVFAAEDGTVAHVSEEFSSFDPNAPATGAKELSESIRDGDLSALIGECAKILRKPALTVAEIRSVTYIYKELFLPPDFIVTLLASLTEGTTRVFSFKRLETEAKKMLDRGIVSTAALSDYLAEKSRNTAAVSMVRRIFGTYGRALSESEILLFKKWTGDFGFGEKMISKAYDIAVRNGVLQKLPYVDKILSSWHEGGVKTPDDADAFGASLTQKKDAPAPVTPPAGRKKDKPRYGTFDPEEAFLAALERSYGPDDRNDAEKDGNEK